LPAISAKEFVWLFLGLKFGPNGGLWQGGFAALGPKGQWPSAAEGWPKARPKPPQAAAGPNRLVSPAA